MYIKKKQKCTLRRNKNVHNEKTKMYLKQCTKRRNKNVHKEETKMYLKKCI